MEKIMKAAFFFFLISQLVFSATQKVPIKQILDNPVQFDRKTVVVEGNVSKLQLRVSKAGNAYSSFHVGDNDGNSIRVFMWGHEKIKELNMKNGDDAEVRGIFWKVKYSGKYRFYNEIEADDIKLK